MKNIKFFLIVSLFFITFSLNSATKTELSLAGREYATDIQEVITPLTIIQQNIGDFGKDYNQTYKMITRDILPQLRVLINNAETLKIKYPEFIDTHMAFLGYINKLYEMVIRFKYAIETEEYVTNYSKLEKDITILTNELTRGEKDMNVAMERLSAKINSMK